MTDSDKLKAIHVSIAANVAFLIATGVPTRQILQGLITQAAHVGSSQLGPQDTAAVFREVADGIEALCVLESIEAAGNG